MVAFSEVVAEADVDVVVFAEEVVVGETVDGTDDGAASEVEA